MAGKVKVQDTIRLMLAPACGRLRECLIYEGDFAELEWLSIRLQNGKLVKVTPVNKCKAKADEYEPKSCEIDAQLRTWLEAEAGMQASAGAHVEEAVLEKYHAIEAALKRGETLTPFPKETCVGVVETTTAADLAEGRRVFVSRADAATKPRAGAENGQSRPAGANAPESPPTPFNLNQYVRVKLTDQGVRHWQDYWGKFDTKDPDRKPYRNDPRREDGYARMQAHEFMRIFGVTISGAYAFSLFDVTVLVEPLNS